MIRRTLFCVVLSLVLGSSAFAGFVNGGFESGDYTGWTQGAGWWYGDMSKLDPPNYLPGGVYYDMSANASAVVGPGLDPRTDNNLNMVYNGSYAARVNDWNNNYSVSVISQKVTNYTDPYIYFAWAAVLESSHGPTDSDNFGLKLTDDTTNTVLYSAYYNSANTPPGLFTYSSWGWYYTQWQVQQLDVSGLSGHDFTLTLLASDCPYGGHAGYVYLDGFGAAPPPPGVPEPATLALMAFGIGGLAVYRLKKR
jgi:hypothetical protein